MSICISCWLIAICLINQSPPSNSYAINSLMSRVTAHSTHINLFPVTDPKINCLAWWVSPAQRGVAETNTKHKDYFRFASFLPLCADLRHQLRDSVSQLESLWRRSLSLFVFWKGPVVTHGPFRSQVGNGIDSRPQTQQKGLRRSNTHSPISIQKHDSAISHRF